MGLERDLRNEVMNLKASIGDMLGSIGRLEDLLKIVIIEKEVKISPP